MLTAVPSVLSPLFCRLCLLRRGLPLLSRMSEVPEFIGVVLLRANQLSSPAQKRVMSVVRAAMDFGFFLAEVSGEPLITDIMLKGRQGFGVRTFDNLVLFG